MENQESNLKFLPSQGARIFVLFNIAIMLLLIIMATMAYFQQGVLLGLIMAPVFIIMEAIWVWIFIIWGDTLILAKKGFDIYRLKNKNTVSYHDILRVEKRGSHVAIITKEKTYRFHSPNPETLKRAERALQNHIQKRKTN